MKKIIEWFKSSKSDFALFILLLILLNVAGINAYKRFDCTQPKSYSLSKASKNIVKNLSAPLSIRVFFDKNLPSQCQTIEQYVKDLLDEYKGVANRNFSVSYMDMSKPKNVELAENLGLNQVQIQEVKNNEVGFKQVYMGLVISYADEVEVIDSIETTDGFEYLITSKISKMISTADALAGLSGDEKIKVTLYLSDSLNGLGIQGLEQTETAVKTVFDNVNKAKQNRLVYNVVRPDSFQVDDIVAHYGIQGVSFDKGGKTEKAAIGVVLETGDDFVILPVYITRSIFGNVIAGLDVLENSINEGIQNLVSKPDQIGYIAGHNEHDINREEECLYFNQLLSQRYKIVQIDLLNDDIPAGITTLIVNGPEFPYNEEELYKIDQFIMRGGNVMFFLDGLVQNPNKQNFMDGQPSFVAKENTIDGLLQKYGITLGHNFVLDKQCYVSNTRESGKTEMYWVPTLQKNQLNQKNPITKNLGYVYVLAASSIDVNTDNPDLTYTVLAKSSDKSWLYDGDGIFSSEFLRPADESNMKSENLFVLVEGKFTSAFDKAVVSKPEAAAENGEAVVQTFETSNYISKAQVPGKIFVSGSSECTTAQLIDPGATNPAAMLILNAVDYMNGNEDLCLMRSKGLSISTFERKSPGLVQFMRLFNMFILPLLAGLSGFIVWNLRRKRKIRINKKYNPDDSRTIVKESKKRSEM